MAAALTQGEPDGAIDPVGHDNACVTLVTEAAGPLLRRAAREGAVSDGVSVTDLLTLTSGIALATEHHADPVTESQRLLSLVVRGVSPGR